MHKISVVGTGYVGLVTAVCFAELGHKVIGYDIDKSKVDLLSKGIPTIYEPGLETYLKENIEHKRLEFTDNLDKAVQESDILFVCVGTPQDEQGRADLSQIETVAKTIAKHLNSYKLIVEKSTVPVKTASWLKKTIAENCPNPIEFSVASNPEFLREGTAVDDVFHPDRVVVGTEDDRAKELMASLYDSFDCPTLFVDLETAEIIKHASNSFLATKISYINMVADLCEEVGADVTQVAKGMGLDPRIGPKFLHAGLGYGGSCFPKDVQAFVHIAEDHEVDFSLLSYVHKINQERVPRLLSRLEKVLTNFSGKTIALWGVAFKPGTDDIREAPSLKIAEQLLGSGAALQCWDPQAADHFQKNIDHAELKFYETPEAAAQNADAVIVVTEWRELRSLNMQKIAKAMKQPVLLDGRNFMDQKSCIEAGFTYLAVGKGFEFAG